MSVAQLHTHAARRKQIRMSNEQVYELLRRYDPAAEEPACTPEQLINFITNGSTMTAVQGKRISQPVYRAFSEGADAGILDDSEETINPETGAKNTVYRLLKTRRAPRAKKDTWKERALAATAAYQKLQEESARRIAELEGNLQGALELVTTPGDPQDEILRLRKLVIKLSTDAGVTLDVALAAV